jgi:hypothetical protein
MTPRVDKTEDRTGAVAGGGRTREASVGRELAEALGVEPSEEREEVVG